MILITTPIDLGHRIRAARKVLGWDQARLAIEAGVSRQWIVEMEKGKARAEIGLVLRTLNALGVSMHLASPGEAASPEPPLDVVPSPHIDADPARGMATNVARLVREADTASELIRQFGPSSTELARLAREASSAVELAKRYAPDATDLARLMRDADSASELIRQFGPSSAELARLACEANSAGELVKRYAPDATDLARLVRESDVATGAVGNPGRGASVRSGVADAPPGRTDRSQIRTPTDRAPAPDRSTRRSDKPPAPATKTTKKRSSLASEKPSASRPPSRSTRTSERVAATPLPARGARKTTRRKNDR